MVQPLWCPTDLPWEILGNLPLYGINALELKDLEGKSSITIHNDPKDKPVKSQPVKMLPP